MRKKLCPQPLAPREDRDRDAQALSGLGEVECRIGREGGFEQSAITQVLAGAEAVKHIDDFSTVVGTYFVWA